jgi:hypothetical protein
MTTQIKVVRLPKCDFCHVNDAKYDFRTKHGWWAYGCQQAWEENKRSDTLGPGLAMELILDTDQK